MIHILFGGETKSKNVYIKELTPDREFFVVSGGESSKDLIMGHSNNISLFGKTPVILIENILSDGSIDFSAEEMSSLKDSETIFIFKEDKLSASDQKKYKKYGDVKNFESKKELPVPKFNIFGITDAFANRDKIKAWSLYLEGISSGVEPEAIAGVLFWKIKTMILNGSRSFEKKELVFQSSNIVSLYHKAHRGEVDFVVSLEQFILASLSSK